MLYWYQWTEFERGTADFSEGLRHSNVDPDDLDVLELGPRHQERVALFEQKYPAIKVNVENAGQGAAQYTKLRTALDAGTGAPDVVMMGYEYTSSFLLTKSLIDLAPYGASKLKDQYVPWVWNQVSRGDAVYGIPQDSGPMGTFTVMTCSPRLASRRHQQRGMNTLPMRRSSRQTGPTSRICPQAT